MEHLGDVGIWRQDFANNRPLQRFFSPYFFGLVVHEIRKQWFSVTDFFFQFHVHK